MIAPKLRSRSGFSLLEMILSMSLMLVVIGLSTQLFRKQSTSVANQSGVLDAQQNSRFAISSLERELRMAGVGVVDQQPLLVMANKLSMTFNADLVALDTGDMGSVYINPDADSAAVDVLRTDPGHHAAGNVADVPRDDLHVEPRRAEQRRDDLVLAVEGFDQQVRQRIRPVSAPERAPGPRGGPRHRLQRRRYDLPLFQERLAGESHRDSAVGAPGHPHRADPRHPGRHRTLGVVGQHTRGARAVHDVFHDPRASTPTYRPQRATIHLMNAGLLHHSTCGQPPLAPGSVTAAVTVANGSTVPQTYVNVSWTKSVDDGAGEKDVIRYAIYRRLSTVTTYDEPFASVPAGSYSFHDTDVQSGQTWIYAVAAVDCSPATSPTSQSSSVAIP